MFYIKSITIASETAEDDAVSTDLKLSPGVIHRVEVDFPAGCENLAHVRIYDGGHQLFPSNKDGSFAADDETVAFNDFYLLGAGYNELTIKTWNDDDTYDHNVRVRIGVLKEKYVLPFLAFNTLTKVLEKLARRLGVR